MRQTWHSPSSWRSWSTQGQPRPQTQHRWLRASSFALPSTREAPPCEGSDSGTLEEARTAMASETGSHRSPVALPSPANTHQATRVAQSNKRKNNRRSSSKVTLTMSDSLLEWSMLSLRQMNFLWGDARYWHHTFFTLQFNSRHSLPEKVFHRLCVDALVFLLQGRFPNNPMLQQNPNKALAYTSFGRYTIFFMLLVVLL